MTNPSSFVSSSRLKSAFALTGLALALSACGGGGGGSDSGYTLGGSVSALTGDGLILSNDGTTLSVAANATSFAFPGEQSGSYDVTILSQPASETCSVVNGSGGGGNGSVTSVSVQCRPYSVFVADSLGTAITQFTIGSDGTLTAATPAGISVDGEVTALAVSSDGQHAWANYQDDKTISNLVINSTGQLSLQGTDSEAGSTSSTGVGLTLSPDGSTLYAANYAAASISAFSIGSTGIASSIGTPVVSGVNPYALAVTSDGTHLYATNQSDDSISGYTIGSGGSLTPLTTAATDTSGQGTSPEGIVANPNSSTLYVVLADSAKLVAYNVSAATGVLTVHTSTTTGTSPRGIAVTPTGTFLYVTNFGDGTVSEYSLAGGSLTALSTPTVVAGTHPSEVTVSPDGKYAYVTNTGDNTISQYSIGSSGILSPLSPATVPSGGQGPIGIAVR